MRSATRTTSSRAFYLKQRRARIARERRIAESYERALAFSVGGASEPERIRRSDWEQWAKAMAFAPRRVLAQLEELALAAPAAAREEHGAFAAAHGDNQAYDCFEESIDDRCRWTLNNVIARR